MVGTNHICSLPREQNAQQHLDARRLVSSLLLVEVIQR